MGSHLSTYIKRFMRIFCTDERFHTIIQNKNKFFNCVYIEKMHR